MRSLRSLHLRASRTGDYGRKYPEGCQKAISLGDHLDISLTKLEEINNACVFPSHLLVTIYKDQERTVAFLLMVSSLVENQCIRGMGPDERGFLSRAKVGLLYFEQQA